mgnify:CR=1 FL=1
MLIENVKKNNFFFIYLTLCFIFFKENKAQKDSLIIQIKNESFFKNNEYFNNLKDGITYIGYNLNPLLTYHLDTTINIDIGWYLRTFIGREKFYNSFLYYQLQWQIKEKFYFIFGNLENSHNHKLIEPIYSDDNYYFKKPEQGIQFLLLKEKIYFDLWLDWQNFILPKEKKKEIFVVGNKTQLNILSNLLRGDFSFTFFHKGGQGTESPEPQLTYLNFSPALNFFQFFKNSSLKISVNYCQFADLSPVKILKYINGYGIYNFIELSFKKKLKFNLSYWIGEYYFSPIGEYLFFSLSQKYVDYQEPSKKIISFKINYSSDISQKVKIEYFFNTYIDKKRKYFDYNFGFLICIDFNKKVKL